jgi:Excalibur calcium-binding domain
MTPYRSLLGIVISLLSYILLLLVVLQQHLSVVDSFCVSTNKQQQRHQQQQNIVPVAFHQSQHSSRGSSNQIGRQNNVLTNRQQSNSNYNLGVLLLNSKGNNVDMDNSSACTIVSVISDNQLLSRRCAIKTTIFGLATTSIIHTSSADASTTVVSGPITNSSSTTGSTTSSTGTNTKPASTTATSTLKPTIATTTSPSTSRTSVSTMSSTTSSKPMATNNNGKPTSNNIPNPGDVKNCPDFATYNDAKRWYDTYYPLYGDVAKLDGNNDGIPCESLPGAPTKKK